jgi:hypothetical protein
MPLTSSFEHQIFLNSIKLNNEQYSTPACRIEKWLLIISKFHVFRNLQLAIYTVVGKNVAFHSPVDGHSYDFKSVTHNVDFITLPEQLFEF